MQEHTPVQRHARLLGGYRGIFDKADRTDCDDDFDGGTSHDGVVTASCRAAMLFHTLPY
jgi:hypothetical protein